MMQLQKNEISKEYFKISYETRKQLIRLVEEEKISIKQASLNLDINYSTGKLIIKKFRKEGKITRFSYEKQFIKKQSTNQAPSLKQNIDESENHLITQSQYQNFLVWYWVPNNYWNFSKGNILEQESIETHLKKQRDLENIYCWFF